MKDRKKKIRTKVWQDRQLYVFLILPVIYIIIFAYVPMSGLAMAFTDNSARKGILEIGRAHV